jgi:hypothetical protein
MPQPPLDYLAGCSKAFCNLADLVLVVDGTDCRVHGQVVAKERKVSIADLGARTAPARCISLTSAPPPVQVIAALLDAQGDDGAEPLQTDEERQAKKARRSGATAGTAAGGRVLSAPFKDCSLPSMQIFLSMLYRPGQVGLLPVQPWEHLFGAMRPADQLDAPLALRYLEPVAVAKLGDNCSKVEHWLPALLGADSLVQQVPQLYDQCVAMAASALLCSMPAANNPPLPAQRLLADARLLQLRPETHVKLLGTFAAGVRGSQGSHCRWRSVSGSLAATWERQGEFTVSPAAWPTLVCQPDLRHTLLCWG